MILFVAHAKIQFTQTHPVRLPVYSKYK